MTDTAPQMPGGTNRVFRVPAVPGGFAAAARAAGILGILATAGVALENWRAHADAAALQSSAEQLGLNLADPQQAYLAWVHAFSRHNLVSGTILSPIDNIPASGSGRAAALQAITAHAGAHPGSFEDLLKGDPDAKKAYEATVAAAVAQIESGNTPGNVRITDALTKTLGACAAFACLAPPVDGFGGGAHGCTKNPSGDGLDSHHMPADAASPLPRDMGPAIRMEPADHRRTSSYGVGATGPAGQLAQRGQVLAAFNLDAAEVETLFPGKYTASIVQARAYAECLRAHGMIR